jgi:polyisoprenyl-phosphate glycosyltransferase
MSANTIILIPFFNDGESLNTLLGELGASLAPLQQHRFAVVVVDDGSADTLSIQKSTSFPVEVLHLQRNIGHQKAIAIGMAWVKENRPCDNLLIMDSDGEDRPEDAAILLQSMLSNPGKIVFAQRKSRQEGKRFRFFYRVYQLFFRVLTGRRIAYGNFMAMPKSILDKAVYYSEIWSHVAGGLLKAGLPYAAVETHRGKRYAGESKMNFTALVLHGLGAIAVFMEVIATRLLFLSLLLIGFSLTAILVLLGIKTFSDYAIPGWTSTVVSAMLIVLLQSFLLSLFTIFLYLSSQSQRKFIPAHHYTDYTGAVETINE